MRADRRAGVLVRAAGLGLAVLIGGAAISPLAQTVPQVVMVSVASSDGTSAPPLTADAFEVFTGGERRAVTRVVPPGPVTALFVGDVSKSVVDRTRTRVSTWIDPVSSAAEHFVRALQPGDRGRLMAVAGSTFEAGPAWTADRQVLAAAARRLVPPRPPVSGSPIWDAVDFELPLFANEQGRKVIVLVTDGRASGNRAHVEEVARRAAAAGVAVSTIELEATPKTLEMVGMPDIPTPGRFLRALSLATGGTYSIARVNEEMSVHDPGPLVANALWLRRSTYLLTVDHAADVNASRVDTVDVRLRRSDLRAQVRESDLSAPGEPAEPRRAAGQIFRAEANLVEVIVRVTDAQGRFVPDLGASDFELRDSGQRESLVAFSTVDLPRRVTGTTAMRTSPSSVGTTAPSPAAERLFVLLLDDMMTSSDFVLPVRRAARQFVEDFVEPTDRVAVFSTAGFGEVGQDLTTDATKVLAAIDRFQGRAGPCGYTPRAGLVESDAEYVYRVRTAADVMVQVARHLGGNRGRRISLLWVSEGVGYDVTNENAAAALGQGERDARDVGTVAQTLRRALDELRRANITLYAVDPRHLWAVGSTGGAHACEDSRRSVDLLRNMAASTGGFAALNSNDYTTAFDRIVEDASQYYVLGFQPSRPGTPGDLRTLEVRVPNRPGVRVAARPAYVVPAADGGGSPSRR